MSQRLHFVNLLGVLTLTALCVFQWKRDRRLNLELAVNEKTRQSQERLLAENSKTFAGLTGDLARFKMDYAAARIEATVLQERIRALERENVQITRDREQLKESGTNWADAVVARDERLRQEKTRVGELARQLNEAVEKFNMLATNYNAVVDELNRARPAAPREQQETPAQGRGSRE